MVARGRQGTGRTVRHQGLLCARGKREAVQRIAAHLHHCIVQQDEILAVYGLQGGEFLGLLLSVGAHSGLISLVPYRENMPGQTLNIPVPCL